MNPWLIALISFAGLILLITLVFLEDIRAIMDRDPAARGFWGYWEILFTYAGLHALILHRITHALWLLHIPLIPRILSQINRFLTGIEIHPAARIGRRFFIDHGKGVVIGETTVIGDDVTLYQGVTLGGTGKDRGKRHPTLKNNIVCGAGSKILGNIVIEDNVKIGANAVVLFDVPSNSTVVGIPGRIVRIKGQKPMDFDQLNLPDPVARRLEMLQKEINLLAKKIHCEAEEKKIRKHDKLHVENL